MRIFKKISPFQKHLHQKKQAGARVGFVPTMGALHDGHLSLVRKSRRENDITVVSVFVNPAQFGPSEDFRRYPRPAKKDILLLKKENADIIIYPSVEEMYPRGYQTFVEVKGLGQALCGHSRPGHFKGVATVVCKLLNIVAPDRIYLGRKDAQQVEIIRKMISDLNMPVKVKTGVTVREADGLAMSSRNRYLTPRQRQEAPALYRLLREARKSIMDGERRAPVIGRKIRAGVKRQTSGRVDYIECVNSKSLVPVKNLKGKILIAVAVHFGKARLIDNITVNVE